MKQFLVLKMIGGLDKVVGLMALPGLHTLESAEQLVNRAAQAEPGASYLIQEVGAA